ncbi:tetratricopeptide repeat protein [Pseudomarimonas arenosa]|uniref:Tetratricopeptide repeat protein n=1 Tax=Pseudomarimonas arenosa TaxID=2774145 RepID=A0AAW3ZNF6_9GAMM|nr:tetratricopeptide repeat protein [Pseudomarimonas arenosa]MBD8527030.1 tetratricopeptide repeat protein [Pseudomarimonas arenosa]
MSRLNLLLWVLLLGASSSWAAEVIDEVDYVELAALLARDGESQKAADALAKVDLAAEGVDLAKYHTVAGLVALDLKQLAQAVESFAAAISAGQVDPLIHLYRAQALFGLERYDEVIKAIDAAGDAVSGLSGAWLMRAHANWMLDRKQAAMDTLAEAAQRFPANTSFQRRQVFYLIEAGLYQQAADLGRDYLQRVEGKPEDFVAIGTALRRARSFDEALGFLEQARLQHPQDDAISKALAQTWLEKGNAYAAAEILAEVAERERSLFAESAELFRRAGHPMRALMLNARVEDSERKLKQRVGILVELKRFEQVAGMESELYRAGLLADEDLRYALAYAFFRGGNFEAVERHLSALTRSDLFRKATELRRLMQDCSGQRWTCG